MSTVRKKYQDFPGKNDFCCDGRFMISKSRGVFYLTLGLIVITSVFFFAFDCRYLAVEFSPLFPVVGGILFFFVLSNLLRTSFIDPGIVPRAKPNEAEFIQRLLDENQAVGGANANRPPRTKEIVINGQVVRVKYCYTCKIFRPPRASHCGVCDNCVERFDHHCPWVGNCVGRRNYRYFYLFVLSLSVYCLFVMGSSITHIVQRGMKIGFLDTIKQSPTSVAVILIAFFSVWSVVGLAGFHTFLILKEQTTNEDIKGTFSNQPVPNGAAQRSALPAEVNPYSRHEFCGNWSYLLCGPFPPSLIDARGIVTEQTTQPSADLNVGIVGSAGQITTTSVIPITSNSELSSVQVNTLSNSGAGAGVSNSTSKLQLQQVVTVNNHVPNNHVPPTYAQEYRADTTAESNAVNLDANDTLTTLCSSPNSPTKVRPILLPAVATVAYSARSNNSNSNNNHSSSSIAYSQIGHNGDLSPDSASVHVAFNSANRQAPRSLHPL